MKKIILMLAALVPVAVVGVYSCMSDNDYIPVSGLIVIIGLFIWSYKDIFGNEYSKEDIRKDRELQENLAKAKKVLSKEEYDAVSNPNFWIDILSKMQISNAGTRNTVFMQIFGLLMFVFSERTCNDLVLYITAPMLYMAFVNGISYLFFRSFKRFLNQLAA